MDGESDIYAGGSTHLAFLRRDGFASMDADGQEGILTTRPVEFTGKHMFVNLEANNGILKVEVLDHNDNVVEPYSTANCHPVDGDKTSIPVSWTGADDLSRITGRPVKFKFHLKNGSLYAFWISNTSSGASQGYVAAGGPDFGGPLDV